MSAAFRLFVPDDDSGIDEYTVPDIVALYLAHLEKRVAADDFSAAYLANIRRNLNAFAAAYPFRISELRQQDLAAWVEKNPQWKSAHMQKGVISSIVTCFNWAADEQRGGLIEKSPYRRVQAISRKPYVPRRPATHDEYERLMAEGCIEFRNALRFIYNTGTRPVEMRDLIFPYLRLDAPIPHLHYDRHKTFRQTGKPKIIGLNDEMVDLLRDLYERRKPGQTHVFLNTDGNPWKPRTFCHHLHNVALRAGLGKAIVKIVSAGCLRTTLACDAIKAGYTNREVADMLGHESTFMVDHVYGAATRQEIAHQGNLAQRMAKDRNKSTGE